MWKKMVTLQYTIEDKLTALVRRLLTLSKRGRNKRGKQLQIRRIAIFFGSRKSQRPIFNVSLPLHLFELRTKFSSMVISLSDERGVKKPSRWSLQ